MQQRKQHFGFKSRQHQLPSIKKRIRDLKRLLDFKTDLDESVRNEKKKEIVELKKRLKNKENAERRQGKYKSVQFFQKKKLLRKKKQIQNKINEIKNEENQNKQQLEEELHKIKQDIFYIDHFPPTQKYIALFPPQDSEEIQKRREKIREKIKQTAEIKDRIKKNTHREKEDEQEEKGDQQFEEDGFFEAEATQSVIRHQKKKKVLISGDIQDEKAKLNKRYKKKKY